MSEEKASHIPTWLSIQFAWSV